jgi:hypothetical protein
MTEFNEFLGPENENTEYKEFAFSSAGLGVVIDSKLAEIYCQNCKFEFNDAVIKNLKKYFKVFIPKYFSAFNNASIEGDLYIGVNDYGFIKGIPYQGELPIDFLEQKIFLNLKKYIKDSSDFNFNDMIDINFINITKPPKPETLSNPKFNDYVIKKNEYLKEYRAWVEKYDQWKIRYMYFTQKLVDLVNNQESRDMLIQFIKTREPDNHCIELLLTDYQLEYKDHEELAELKNDSSSVYYWVCSWKDHITDYLKTLKPIFNNDFNQHNLPINMIMSGGEMIPYWMNFNSNMNLYLIHIKFKQIIGSEIKIVKYREHNKKEWLSCYRSSKTDGNPFCKPF